ncbi:unnamed protein product, partial [Amoebophrya sp. A120]
YRLPCRLRKTSDPALRCSLCFFGLDLCFFPAFQGSAAFSMGRVVPQIHRWVASLPAGSLGLLRRVAPSAVLEAYDHPKDDLSLADSV